MGTPIGVQQKLMRHADIRTTMNVYGDAIMDDMRSAHEKVCATSDAKGLNELWDGLWTRQVLERMGWETGIEPATSGATVRCSAD